MIMKEISKKILPVSTVASILREVIKFFTNDGLDLISKTVQQTRTTRTGPDLSLFSEHYPNPNICREDDGCLV